PPEVQNVIYNVRPGLTGIGSIVFRDEEELISEIKRNGGSVWDFYRERIYPHKGKLEEWYQQKMSFWLDLSIIFLTAWVIIFPRSELYYRWFRDLPRRDF
ncbi:MAG: sugar transferase, partial [Saprospiraceae bacterium]|nr:sugar transferase [Saprospiraceae bacterium]